MKKFISLMISLAFTFGLMVNANAAEVSNFDELKACIKSETETLCKIVNAENNTLTMTSGLKTVGEKTLDLNGAKLVTPGVAFLVDGTTLRIEGTGSIEGSLSIEVLGSLDATQTNYSVLYVGPNVTIKDKQYAIAIFPASGKETYGVDITIDGTTLEATYGGVYINGTSKNTVNAPQIKINDGSTIVATGNETYTGVGIYGAGYANWTIGKANIEAGGSGLAIKAGKWVINGAYVKGTGEDSTPTEGFSNGINASGAAIQIESNSAYVGDINLEINSGKFESLHSYAIYEYLDSSTTDTKVVNIHINDGEFIASEKLSFGVSTEFNDKFTKFINGGTFTGTIPASFVTDNFETIVEDGKTTVRAPRANYTAVDEALAEAKKYAAADYTTESYAELTKAINAVVRDLDNTKQDEVNQMGNNIINAIKTLVKLEDPVTTIPEVDVTEKVEEVIVGVTDREETEKLLLEELAKSDIETDGKNIAISVNVYTVLKEEIDEKIVGSITDTIKDNFKNAVLGGYFDVNILVFDRDSGEYLGSLTDLNKKVNLSIVLPEELKTVEEGYTRTYYVIRYHDGKTDIINTTLSEDGNSLEFESDKFSTLALTYEDVKIEEPASTYDGVGAYMALGFISLISLASASIYLKKYNK